MTTLNLNFRSQRLGLDLNGRNVWEVLNTSRSVEAGRTALVLCDVWDNHHSRAARERLEVMIPRMNAVVKAARGKGVLIVHSPSDVIEFYKDHPARRRVLEVAKVEVPKDLEHADPSSPVDAS